jgi:hypothetical protein
MDFAHDDKMTICCDSDQASSRRILCARRSRDVRTISLLALYHFYLHLHVFSTELYAMQSPSRVSSLHPHRLSMARSAMASRRGIAPERERATVLPKDWRDFWGVEYKFPTTATSSAALDRTNDASPFWQGNIHDAFPSTIHQVTDTVAATIEAILRSNQTFLDPNLIQNTVHGNTVMGRRSVRHSSHDIGRIGIELDWSVNDGDDNEVSNRYDLSAVRLASLILAGKLSQYKPYESQERNSNCYQNQRPIAVYFNTVQQALEASRQLRQLKRMNFPHSEAKSGVNVSSTLSSVYDCIHIRCLCQGDSIPKDLTLSNEDFGTSRSRRWRGLVAGAVNPAAGLVLIVQPTDYNDEYRPPGPSIGVVESLQKLVAAAAIEQLPVVLISPRFLKTQSFAASGWDQSGYHQQSSLYAGLEPPKGPTPWILRDFTPPAFCYVANALPLYDGETPTNRYGASCRCSHLSLWQSVMLKSHAWHVFAAFQEASSTTYEYSCIATTKNSAGRPTRQVMRQLWSEYARDLKIPVV